MNGKPIIDPYDGAEYATAEDFLEACWHDTWAPFEEMGLRENAIIYEGGVQNLWLQTWDKDCLTLFRMPKGPLYLHVPEGNVDVMSEAGLTGAAAASVVLTVTEPASRDGFEVWKVDIEHLGIVPMSADAKTWRLLEFKLPRTRLKKAGEHSFSMR